ncbi:MAG: hypothetical protein ACK5L3_08045 [Oscillospiraceae bacterium]
MDTLPGSLFFYVVTIPLITWVLKRVSKKTNEKYEGQLFISKNYKKFIQTAALAVILLSLLFVLVNRFVFKPEQRAEPEVPYLILFFSLFLAIEFCGLLFGTYKVNVFEHYFIKSKFGIKKKYEYSKITAVKIDHNKDLHFYINRKKVMWLPRDIVGIKEFTQIIKAHGLEITEKEKSFLMKLSDMIQ